ncbi:MAG: rhodanese-like domain-containing protein [Gammaproteobacteria bacterium]|nr:rhodanese-like domain-containing protein [Gammaproteobacteria bacterium]
MDQMLEFVSNHALLNVAVVVIVFLIIKMELERFTSGIVQINPFEAIRALNDDNAIVLDVREIKEFNDGHLKDAVHIPLSDFKSRLDELSKYKDKRVIAYCRSGSRSYSACKTLKKAGFEAVNNLQGGIMAWQNQNMPVSKK